VSPAVPPAMPISLTLGTSPSRPRAVGRRYSGLAGTERGWASKMPTYRICLVDTHDDPIESDRVFCGRTMTCFDAGAQTLMRPVDDWGADWRLASSSATNSFFDNLPTGVFGNEGRISISVGIS
jgi:hypothetical protein